MTTIETSENPTDGPGPAGSPVGAPITGGEAGEVRELTYAESVRRPPKLATKRTLPPAPEGADSGARSAGT